MLMQIILFSLSITAVFLSQRKTENIRKWACVFGLLSQPFWFIATWGTWGMFAISIVYTFIWAESFYNTFIKTVPTTVTE